MIPGEEYSRRIGDLLHAMLNLIHEDIYEREPRGQLQPGQEVTWHRCWWLLKFKDDVNDVLDEMEAAGF